MLNSPSSAGSAAPPVPGLPTIALIMPAGRVFDRLVAEAIAPGVAELPAELDRLPTSLASPGALPDFHHRLDRAQLVLADLTGRNPHVLYLLGRADALGKRTVLLIQHAEEFPFDARARPPVVYAGRPELLREALREVWRGAVDRADTAAQVDPTPAAHASALPADDAWFRFDNLFGDLLAAHGHEHRGVVRLESENVFVLEEQDMDLALVQALARRAKERGLRLKLL